jgi:hypothetical protein
MQSCAPYKGTPQQDNMTVYKQTSLAYVIYSVRE